MGKTLTFILTVASAVTLASCDGEAPREVIDAIPIVLVDDSTYRAYFILVVDSLPVITQIQGNIEGDILHLNIKYLGGCEEQEFEMFAGRFISYSLPPQGHTLLVNSVSHDTCKVETRTTLTFDLTPYREYLQSSGLVNYGPIIVGINRGLLAFAYHY